MQDVKATPHVSRWSQNLIFLFFLVCRLMYQLPRSSASLRSKKYFIRNSLLFGPILPVLNLPLRLFGRGNPARASHTGPTAARTVSHARGVIGNLLSKVGERRSLPKYLYRHLMEKTYKSMRVLTQCILQMDSVSLGAGTTQRCKIKKTQVASSIQEIDLVPGICAPQPVVAPLSQ